jgi:hypothetical protein
MKLKLILVDPVEEVCDARTQNFEGLPNVKIVNGLAAAAKASEGPWAFQRMPTGALLN